MFIVEGFAAEFHWIKLDGTDLLSDSIGSCTGQFCSYCPTVTDGNDDRGEAMTEDYGDYDADCKATFHGSDLMRQKDENGSLRLENLWFYNVRSQYSSLVKMKNSPNLVMKNTKFEKVQAKPWVSVVHI